MFGFLQRIKVQVNSQESRFATENNVFTGFSNWLNLFKIKKTAPSHLIQQYKQLFKKITRDSLHTMFLTDELMIKFKMQQIVSH